MPFLVFLSRGAQRVQQVRMAQQDLQAQPGQQEPTVQQGLSDLPGLLVQMAQQDLLVQPGQQEQTVQQAPLGLQVQRAPRAPLVLPMVWLLMVGYTALRRKRLT